MRVRGVVSRELDQVYDTEGPEKLLPPHQTFKSLWVCIKKFCGCLRNLNFQMKTGKPRMLLHEDFAIILASKVVYSCTLGLHLIRTRL